MRKTPDIREYVLLCTACDNWTIDCPPRAVSDFGGQRAALWALGEVCAEHTRVDCPGGTEGRIKIDGQWVERPMMSHGKQADGAAAALVGVEMTRRKSLTSGRGEGKVLPMADTKTPPKQQLVESLVPAIPGVVADYLEAGETWDDISVRVNAMLADTGVHVKVSRESLRQWYRPAPATT